MSLWRVTVRKAITGSAGISYKWSNVYYVDRADLSAALASGQGIWTRERGFHSVDAFCYQIYVSDLVPNTTNFVQAPPPSAVQFGTYANTGSDWYFSGVAQRVDLFVTASRPSRKFYHPPFTEQDIVDGRDTVAAFQTALSTGVGNIVALPELRDVDGQTVTGWGNFGLTHRRIGRDSFVNVPNPQGA